MRSTLIILAAVGLAGLSTALIHAALRAENPGRLMVDGDTKDVGRLRQGQTAHAEFSLTNGTWDRIKLLEISPSCSCTVIAPGVTELPPGGSTTIRAAYNAHDSRGRSSTTLMVRHQGSSEPQASYMPLTIVAAVEPDYDVSVDRLDFPTDRRSTQSVVLTRRLVDHLKVTRATCNHPAFEARVVEPGPGESKWTVELTLDTDRLASSPMTGSEELIQTTDNEHEPTHRIRIFAKK